MPVESAAPGVQHREESAVHFPVVALKLLQRSRGCVGQSVSHFAVVHREQIVKLFGNGEDNMEMRAIRQSLTDLRGPLRLPRPQTGRAMAVSA